MKIIGVPARFTASISTCRLRDAVCATGSTRMGRAVAPLKQASDAVLLDTSTLTPDQAIAEALRLADQLLARAEP